MAEKNTEMEQKYVKTMLENDLFAIVYPKDKTEESARKMVDMIDSAVGVAELTDDDGNSIWGTLIDKVKEAKKQIKTDPPEEAETREEEAE